MRRMTLVFLLLIFGQPAFGQTLDDYLVLAAENNPGLKAGFSTYLAALERAPQVRGLPDPEVSFGWFVRPMARLMGEQVVDISAMQMFPWFGTRDAAGTEAALMAKAKFEEFKEARASLFYKVKTTWSALYLKEKEIAITKEHMRILRSLEEIAINRFKSGDSGSGGMGAQAGASGKMGGRQSGMVDVLRIQMEINALGNKLALLDDNRRILAAQFNTLLNRPLDVAVVLPDSLVTPHLPVPVAQIPDSIRAGNPMLRMLEKEEEAFVARANTKRKMGFPMIGIGVQYSVFRPRDGSDMARNGRNMVMPMATVRVPLWRGKHRASVAEAERQRDVVIAQHRETRNALLVNHEEVLKDFRDAERRLILSQRQTTLAGQALNILTVEYASAGQAFEEVLQMQIKLLDYRLEALNAVVDQHVAVAMLERLMGR